MEGSSSIVILMVLTMNFMPEGATADIDCKFDSELCVEKPSAYDTFQNKVDSIVENNKHFISQSYDDDDLEYEGVRYVGSRENCEAETDVVMPFAIKTNVSTEYVVQSPIFRQKIRRTRCISQTNSCFNSVKPSDLESFCEEKYGSVSLYIYDPTVNEIRYKMFEIPVCCVCKLREPMRK